MWSEISFLAYSNLSVLRLGNDDKPQYIYLKLANISGPSPSVSQNKHS